MTEIGIHGFAAGDDQHQATRRISASRKSTATEERETIEGIERRKHLRVDPDPAKPGAAIDHKPQDDDRPENGADAEAPLN